MLKSSIPATGEAVSADTRDKTVHSDIYEASDLLGVAAGLTRFLRDDEECSATYRRDLLGNLTSHLDHVRATLDKVAGRFDNDGNLKGTPVPAQGMAAAAGTKMTYNEIENELGDLQCDIGHLSELLNAGVDALVGIKRGVDKEIDSDLDRAEAFVWAARDLTDKIYKPDAL